jgi:hypothetical protein
MTHKHLKSRLTPSHCTPFPCTRCGACCREGVRLGILPPGDDGVSCYYQQLDPKGLSFCSIYEQRPSYCRVDDSRPEETPPSAWHREVTEACQKLILREGLGARWVPRLPTPVELAEAASVESSPPDNFGRNNISDEEEVTFSDSPR